MAFSAKSYPSREQRHFPNRFRRQTGQTRRPPRPLGSPWQHRPASGMKDLSRWTKDTFDRSVPSNTRVSERGTSIDHCDCAPRHLPRHLPRHTTLLNKEQNHDDDGVCHAKLICHFPRIYLFPVHRVDGSAHYHNTTDLFNTIYHHDSIQDPP